MATYGWVTEAEAETYFETRLGASEFWANSTDKPSALLTAYTQLRAIYSTFRGYIIPTTATDNMKTAQFEQALFLLVDNPLRRQSLQAQGVVVAGILKETYKYGPTVAIAFTAANLMEQESRTSGAKAATLTRDEDEDVV